MISVKRITKYFHRGSINEVLALEKIDLDIRRGDFITIIGSNGAGKSTLLNCLAGCFPTDEGKVFMDEMDVTSWPEHRRANFLSRVFQNPLLGTCASLTIEQNLALAARRGLRHGLGLGVKRADRELFRGQLKHLKLGLEDRLRDKVGLLSGGQRQRVAIARALATNPRLLVADEPVSALDVSLRGQVINLLADLRQRLQLTVLLIAHDLAVVEQIADRVAVMYAGKIVELASTRSVYRDPQHPYTVSLLSAVPSAEPLSWRNRIVLSGEPPNLAALPSGCRFHPRCPVAQDRCRIEEPTLVEIDLGHEAACHYPGELASPGDTPDEDGTF